jgi:sporulation protein YlmC with PRC-barrel domain
MEVQHSHVRVGAEVLGSDARSVGTVKAVGKTHFLVDRGLQRDIEIPFDAVQAVTDRGVVLGVPARRAVKVKHVSSK